MRLALLTELIAAYVDHVGLRLRAVGPMHGADECYVADRPGPPPPVPVPDLAVFFAPISGDALIEFHRLGVPELWVWEGEAFSPWRRKNLFYEMGEGAALPGFPLSLASSLVQQGKEGEADKALSIACLLERVQSRDREAREEQGARELLRSSTPEDDEPLGDGVLMMSPQLDTNALPRPGPFDSDFVENGEPIGWNPAGILLERLTEEGWRFGMCDLARLHGVFDELIDRAVVVVDDEVDDFQEILRTLMQKHRRQPLIVLGKLPARLARPGPTVVLPKPVEVDVLLSALRRFESG